MVKKMHLEGAGFEQLTNLGFRNRRNIIKLMFCQGLQLRQFQHAPVTHQGDLAEPKALDQGANLFSHGFRILGVASKYPHRHRVAFGTGEKSDDKLLFSLFAVPVVTESGQDVVDALQVRAGDIIQKQLRWFGAVAPAEETLFNFFLIRSQPGKILIEMVFVEGFQTQDITGGVAFGQPDGAQTGALIDQSGKDLPQGQFTSTLIT